MSEKGLIFEWRGGSNEGLARGDEGCIAHVKKVGDDGYLADLWEYKGKVILDLTCLIDSEIFTDRESIQKADLENSRYATPEEWGDVKLARFLEANTKWIRPD